MTITLDIQKTVYGGDGLGRLGDGRVCFVPGAFAGETVRAEITEQRKRFVKARLVDVLVPLADRLAPDVRGDTVPGMVYAEVSPAAEMRFKQDQLENFLWKVSPEVLPLDVVPAERVHRYRAKATYHTQKIDGKWTMGYRKVFSHDVVDIVRDPLACDEINAALPQIRAAVFAFLSQHAGRRATEGENVTVRWTAVDGVKWWIGAPPREMVLHEKTAGVRFTVPGDGFYQVNPEIGEKLAQIVRSRYLAGLETAGDLLDLYCGVGVFGIVCAHAAAQKGATPLLTGIESGRAAIAMAQKNALAAGVKGRFFCERVGASLGRIKVGSRHTVILDPPRGGLEPNVAAFLAKRAAPRIFYVSCDPATLTRDLQALMPAYRIERATLLNMFPRTARFETFVELVRRGV